MDAIFGRGDPGYGIETVQIIPFVIGERGSKRPWASWHAASRAMTCRQRRGDHVAAARRASNLRWRPAFTVRLLL